MKNEVFPFFFSMRIKGIFSISYTFFFCQATADAATPTFMRWKKSLAISLKGEGGGIRFEASFLKLEKLARGSL